MRLPLRAVFPCFVAVAMAAGLAAGSGCAVKPAPQAEAKSAAAAPSESGAAQSVSQAQGATARAGPTAASPKSETVAASAEAGGGGASADRSAAVTAGSAAVTAGSAAPVAQSAAPAGSTLPVTPVARTAQTSDERRDAIDKQLNDSLGSFDAKLRSEQQRIAQERDARQATVATVAATDGTAESPGAEQHTEAACSAATEDSDKPASSHGEPNSRRGESRSARAGDLKSDKAAGGANGNAAGNGAVANEIPDGNDDDIVARRLRKAAEQETDPELKDKLWKEYVEYKKNNQGR